MPDSPTSKVFFTEVSSIITEARNNAMLAVNTAMVEAYWNIGKRIVLEEQDGNARARY